MSDRPIVRDPLSKEEWKPDDVLFYETEDYGNVEWKVTRGDDAFVVRLSYRDANVPEVVETEIPSSAWYAVNESQRGRLAMGYVMTAAYREDLVDARHGEGDGQSRLPSGRCRRCRG